MTNIDVYVQLGDNRQQMQAHVHIYVNYCNYIGLF